jgi:hypothetical protein
LLDVEGFGVLEVEGFGLLEVEGFGLLEVEGFGLLDVEGFGLLDVEGFGLLEVVVAVHKFMTQWVRQYWETILGDSIGSLGLNGYWEFSNLCACAASLGYVAPLPFFGACFEE